MSNRINLTSGSTPVRKSGLLITRDDGKTIYRFPYQRNSYELNESASLIWQLCDGIRNYSGVCSEVSGLTGDDIGDVENVVSDTIVALIGKGLIDLNGPQPNPIIKIAFFGAPSEFQTTDNFFLYLFVNWFDLLLVEANENPDLLVCWDAEEAEDILENVAICCLVDNFCKQKSTQFDLYFRPDNCLREPDAVTLSLPDDYIDNPVPPLNETDRAVLNAMFRPDTAKNDEAGDLPLPSVKSKLTIGMATFDDYDGVYFTVQAIRVFHPEVTAETEILVIDNNPGGICSKALRGLQHSVPGYRYVANDELKGTAVRDFVFQEADSEYVMCIDSHVLIEPGAIRKLIDYFDDNPSTADLLQGPLVYDDHKKIATHFEPVWRQGMFGIWGCDDRGLQPDGEAFEIPMQGLGLAACRKDAWQGYNRRFSGFGGEEGYIHQKFRNAGAKVLCLPFLRWMHRFERPMGTRYTNVWEDRIRNYLIGFEEVGLDQQAVREHFCKEINEEVVDRVENTVSLEQDNPFEFFDAIYCINLDRETERWNNVLKRFEKLGIRYRVQRFSAVETPESHHLGCTLTHRQIVAEAKEKGYENILVFEDDVIFHVDTLEHLDKSITELRQRGWSIFYLGGMKWMKLGRKPFEKIPGCGFLERPQGMTCTHAVAYHASFYNKLLADIPATVEGVENWIRDSYPAIDQYLPAQDHLVVMSPVIASQPALLKEEDESMQAGFA